MYLLITILTIVIKRIMFTMKIIQNSSTLETFTSLCHQSQHYPKAPHPPPQEAGRCPIMPMLSNP